MTEEKTGYEKAKETRDKISGNVSQEQSLEAFNVEEALKSVSENEVLRKLYGDSAGLGAENLGGESLPILKVHTGKSRDDSLANGEDPKIGNFFYKKTKEQFESVYCHILTISRGFRCDGVGDATDVFNQILGGVIIDGSELKPFLMYFTGKKLQGLWNFAKVAGEYTRMKPVGIPMFALTIKLSTQKVDTKYGPTYLVNFDISRDTAGNPEVITDEATFRLVRDNVEKVSQVIDKIIINKISSNTAEDSEVIIEGEESFPTTEVSTSEKEMPF